MLRKFPILLAGFLFLSVPFVRAAGSVPVYILVHGAFQAASGWDPVIKALETTGNTAIAVQLPGRDGDTISPEKQTLEAYRDAVVKVIEQQSQPVILVGHSFGGIVVSTVAEAVPDRVKTVVYLGAYLPRSGDSLVSLSPLDHYSELGKAGNFIVSPDYKYASVNKAVFASAFCPDCNPDQLKQVAASQLDEPLAPLNEKVTLTDEKFGSVRKAYIMTAQDVIVSPQLQALMLSYTPVDHVYAVDSGHAAYVTQPEMLAKILEEIGAAS